MDIEIIEEEIAKLEEGDTSWANIEKLSWLYSVYDHFVGDGNFVPVKRDIMPEYTGEFGRAVSGRSIDEIMNVLSEHMSVVKVLHPKEYQAVIDKIKEIP